MVMEVTRLDGDGTVMDGFAVLVRRRKKTMRTERDRGRGTRL